MHEWERDTLGLSYHDYDHPAFIQAVNLGTAAIPELTNLLGENWFPILVLFKVLGDKSPPIPEESRGKFDDLNKIMREWLINN